MMRYLKIDKFRDRVVFININSISTFTLSEIYLSIHTTDGAFPYDLILDHIEEDIEYIINDIIYGRTNIVNITYNE